MSRLRTRSATQLLKLIPSKTTVIHAMQPRDPTRRVYFCSWFLQFVAEGELDPQLTFFPDEARFRLQRYKTTQNNRYWSSRNPYLTQEVPLHPVEVGIWSAVSARRFVAPVFFNRAINC
jgi:hypothetical protein